MNSELADLCVMLTRQESSVGNLAAKIADLGGNSVHLPLFAIESLLDQALLDKISLNLNNCSLAICISRNAAEILMPHCKAFTHIPWATIGPGTASCLLEHGVKQVLCPKSTPYDSSALFQIINSSNMNQQNQYIMIFTGEKGDDWLSYALLEQKAVVETVPLYKRVMPSISTEQVAQVFSVQPGIDIILITCVSSLVNLIQLANAATIKIINTPLLVVSQRIYKYALAQGFTTVYIAKSMSEEDILFALVNLKVKSRGEKNAENQG